MMKTIIKILQAYKNGKITEKELTLLLDIKKRGNFHLLEAKKDYFQIWNNNQLLTVFYSKEEADEFISKADDLLNTCLKETK